MGTIVVLYGFQIDDQTSKKKVTLTVEVTNCDQIDSLFLFEFDGVLFRRWKATDKSETGQFKFVLPKTSPRFYYVGLGGNNIKPIIVGPEDKLSLKSDCQAFNKSIFIDSPLNNQYAAVKTEVSQHKQQFNVLVRNYQRNLNRPAEIKKITSQMKALDGQRKIYLDSLKKEHPYFGEVAALNTYLSFQNNGGDYANEIEYFAKEFFQFADWQKEEYNYLPWVYESMKSYTTTLSSINLLPKKQEEYIQAVLKEIPENTRTYKLALGGVLSGLMSKNQSNYLVFGKQFIEKYEKEDPAAAAQVAKEVEKLAAFSIGGEAPDFTMNDAEGNPKKLSDFRGQILLVDFWASWCGPCRRENPHVKKLYEKYHDRGFDILGVSLDKDKNRWLGAIEKDNLTWNHVSDLKGWQNEAAKLYGVRSIPETILLDNEGKIIARKLRGPSLEAKLKEIFGD